MDRDRLDEAEVDPERLPVYRESDDGDDPPGGWQSTETTVVDADEEEVRIEADTDGFSAFAVAAERPELDPGEAALSAEAVAPGEELTIEVPLSNVGPAPASGAELRIETAEETTAVIDGRFTVDADAGATTTESVTVRLSDPGRYELVVTGDTLTESTGVGTVAVEAPIDDDAVGADTGAGDDSSGQREGSEDDDDGTSTERSEFDLSDLAGLLALIAIILATLFLVRRAPR